MILKARTAGGTEKDIAQIHASRMFGEKEWIRILRTRRFAAFRVKRVRKCRPKRRPAKGDPVI